MGTGIVVTQNKTKKKKKRKENYVNTILKRQDLGVDSTTLTKCTHLILKLLYICKKF